MASYGQDWDQGMSGFDPSSTVRQPLPDWSTQFPDFSRQPRALSNNPYNDFPPARQHGPLGLAQRAAQMNTPGRNVPPGPLLPAPVLTGDTASATSSTHDASCARLEHDAQAAADREAVRNQAVRLESMEQDLFTYMKEYDHRIWTIEDHLRRVQKLIEANPDIEHYGLPLPRPIGDHLNASSNYSAHLNSKDPHFDWASFVEQTPLLQPGQETAVCVVDYSYLIFRAQATDAWAMRRDIYELNAVTCHLILDLVKNVKQAMTSDTPVIVALINSPLADRLPTAYHDRIQIWSVDGAGQSTIPDRTVPFIDPMTSAYNSLFVKVRSSVIEARPAAKVIFELIDHKAKPRIFFAGDVDHAAPEYFQSYCDVYPERMMFLATAHQLKESPSIHNVPNQSCDLFIERHLIQHGPHSAGDRTTQLSAPMQAPVPMQSTFTETSFTEPTVTEPTATEPTATESTATGPTALGTATPEATKMPPSDATTDPGPTRIRTPPGLKSWADLARARANEPLTIMRSPSPPPGTEPVQRNKFGQRLDKPMPIDKAEYDRVRALKLCATYYLRGGTCRFGARCENRHDHPASPADLRALRAIARTHPCALESACPDPLCIYGHICPMEPRMRDPAGPACSWGGMCKFPGRLHGLDRVPVPRPPVLRKRGSRG